MKTTLKAILAATTALAAIAIVAPATYAAEPAPADTEEAQTEDARLSAFFEEVFQRNLKDSPLFQSQLGMKGPDYGKWDDFSDADVGPCAAMPGPSRRSFDVDDPPPQASGRAKASTSAARGIMRRLRNPMKPTLVGFMGHGCATYRARHRDRTTSRWKTGNPRPPPEMASDRGSR